MTSCAMESNTRTRARMFLMSWCTVSATPGYCTLTTTGLPPRSVARCTCPSDAAATASGAVAQVAGGDPAHLRPRHGWHRRLHHRQPLERLRREEILPHAEQLGHLHECAAQLRRALHDAARVADVRLEQRCLLL